MGTEGLDTQFIINALHKDVAGIMETHYDMFWATFAKKDRRIIVFITWTQEHQEQ